MIIFFLIIFTISCNNSTSGNSEDKIVGKWAWIQSSGGYTGDTINPDIVGYSIILAFEENGVYKEYKNGLLKFSSKYFIEKKPYGSINNKRDFLIIDNRNKEQLIEFEKSISLKLIENCWDCYIHSYKRLSYF